MSPPKRKVGRPSKYPDLDYYQVQFLAENGFIDRQMAAFFGVCEDTWHTWKKVHPEFSESLKGWKAKFDKTVERALFERATGYSHIDTKFATHEGLIMDEREYIKHYPPDTTAAIFWLKNRRPERWRDASNIELSGKVGVEDVTDIEKARIIAAALAKGANAAG